VADSRSSPFFLLQSSVDLIARNYLELLASIAVSSLSSSSSIPPARRNKADPSFLDSQRLLSRRQLPRWLSLRLPQTILRSSSEVRIPINDRKRTSPSLSLPTHLAHRLDYLPFVLLWASWDLLSSDLAPLLPFFMSSKSTTVLYLVGFIILRQSA